MFLENFQGSGISAWDFWGFIFGRGIFWVLLEALQGMVLGFDFPSHLFIPVTWNSEYPLPPGHSDFHLRPPLKSEHLWPLVGFQWIQLWFWGLFHKKRGGIELFSLYSHFRQTTWWYPRELFLSIVVLLMHVHPHAHVCIINEKRKGKFPGEHHVGNQNIQEKLRGMGSAPHFPTPTTVPTGAPTVFFALSLQIENQDVGLRTVHLFCVKPHFLFYLFLRLWYNRHVKVLLLKGGKFFLKYVIHTCCW